MICMHVPWLPMYDDPVRRISAEQRRDNDDICHIMHDMMHHVTIKKSLLINPVSYQVLRLNVLITTFKVHRRNNEKEKEKRGRRKART